MHLIDKHTFPKEYDFFIVNDGIDRRSSMLRSGRHRRGSSSAAVIQAEKARRRASTLEGSGGSVEREEGDENDDGMNVDVREEEDEEGEGEQKGVVGKKGVERVPPPGNVTRTSKVSDDAMEDLVGGISALKFIPPSVRFGRGRGKGRGGFSRS